MLTGLLCCTSLLLFSSAVFAQQAPASPANPQPQADSPIGDASKPVIPSGPKIPKEAYLEAKASPLQYDRAAWHKKLNKRIGKTPKPVVNIYTKWNHEYMAFDLGDIKGPSQDRVNYFLRCHFTNEPTNMDPRLFPVLLKAAQKFRVRKVDVVSGFRAPKYNLTLRKKGRQVARNSEHTLGHAVDFRLPGIKVEKLHAWARSLRLGGVGFYNRSRFIHVDVGRIRFWNGT